MNHINLINKIFEKKKKIRYAINHIYVTTCISNKQYLTFVMTMSVMTSDNIMKLEFNSI